MAERRKSKYPEFRPEDIAAAGADTPQYYSSAIFNAPQGGFDPASPPQKSSTLNPPAPSLTRQRSNSQIVPNSAGFYPPPGTAPGYNKGATGPMPPPGPGGPPPSGGPSLLASAIGGSQGPPPPPGPGGYYPGSHGGTPMGYGSGGGYYGGPSWGPGYGPGSPAGSMGGYGSPMGGSAGADSPMGYNVGGHPGYGQATPGGYGGSQFKPPARSLTKDELEEKAESAFFFYDRDKSGFLDMQEYYPAVCYLYQLMNQTPPSELEAMYIFGQHDKNKDRRLSFNEFMDIMNYLVSENKLLK